MAESIRRQRNRYILRQLFIHGAEDFVPFIQLAKALFAAILFAFVLETALTIDSNAERETIDSDSPCKPQGTADPFCLPQHTVVFDCKDYKIERVAAKNDFQVQMSWTNITSESAYFLEKNASTGKAMGNYQPFVSDIVTNGSVSVAKILKRLPYFIEVVKTKDSKCKHTYLLSCTKLVNEIGQMTHSNPIKNHIIKEQTIPGIKIERERVTDIIELVAVSLIGLSIVFIIFSFVFLCICFVVTINEEHKYADVECNTSEVEDSSNRTDAVEEKIIHEEQQTEQKLDSSAEGELNDWAIM